MGVGNEFRVGWPVLAGTVLGIGCGVSALLLYTSGLFVAGLEAEFGLTRTQFGFGVLMSTIALALANPVVGWAVDRWGVRRPAAFGLVALASGFSVLGTLVGSVVGYMVVQTATAFLAAASGPTAYVKTVSAWFMRARGLALGIAMTGIGVAAAILPPLVGRVIAADGWRAGYMMLAVIASCGLVPLLLLVRLPNTYGGSNAAALPGMSVDTAVRTRAFILLVAAFSAMALGFAGLLPHFVPMLTDLGLSAPQAGSLAGLIGVSVIGSRLAVGALTDRVFAPWVAIGVCLLCAAGCLILYFGGVVAAPIGALALGIAMGGEVDLIGYMVARYFGLAAFGRIYGLFYAAFILASGVSPLWIGIVRDRTGDYDIALAGAAGLVSVAALLFLFMPRYPASPQ